MTTPRPTAPLWARAIGITTRNQALQLQAYAMGFDSRAQLERYRKAANVTGNAELSRAWRQLLDAQTKAQIAIERNDHTARDLITVAQARKRAYNDVLRRTRPSENPIGSPKAQPE